MEEAEKRGDSAFQTVLRGRRRGAVDQSRLASLRPIVKNVIQNEHKKVVRLSGWGAYTFDAVA